MQVRRALDNRSLDEFVERMNYGVFGDLFLLDDGVDAGKNSYENAVLCPSE